MKEPFLWCSEGLYIDMLTLHRPCALSFFLISDRVFCLECSHSLMILSNSGRLPV